jgi:hypothetical protein
MGGKSPRVKKKKSKRSSHFHTHHNFTINATVGGNSISRDVNHNERAKADSLIQSEQRAPC